MEPSEEKKARRRPKKKPTASSLFDRSLNRAFLHLRLRLLPRCTSPLCFSMQAAAPLVLLLVVAAMLSVATAWLPARPSPLAIGRRAVLSSATRIHLFGRSAPKDNGGAKNEGGGMLGGLGNIMENMKKAQEAMKQAETLKAELGRQIISGSDPSGQASASFDGLGNPISIHLSESLIAQGAEAASRAASQAIQDAHSKTITAMTSRMQSLFPGMSLPK